MEFAGILRGREAEWQIDKSISSGRNSIENKTRRYD